MDFASSVVLINCHVVCRIENFFLRGAMLQNVIDEIRRGTHAALVLPWTGAIGLAIVVSILYFLLALLSLALLAEPDGVALFWPAAGVSSGVPLAIARDAQMRSGRRRIRLRRARTGQRHLARLYLMPAKPCLL